MDSYLPEDDIELRSHEVQEIISQIPSGFLRWGMTIMFSVILCLLITAWFVEYPDVLNANVVITTNPAPVTLVSRGEGNLILLKSENDVVHKKELIAYLQTNATPESVLLLESRILSSDSFTDSFQGTLGDLENDHGTYVRSLDALALYRENLPHQAQITQLNKQCQSYLKLQKSLRDQLALSQQELVLSREKYKMDTLLFSQKVSAPAEFSKERSVWLQQQRSFSNAEIALVNNELQINQINNQIAELELEQKERFKILELELETSRKSLLAHIAQWKRSYLFESPSEGHIAYIGFLENDLFISSGKSLFSIVQPEGHFLVRAQLPVENSGKVKKGQRVNIRLTDYPFEQYGMLTGVVASVSLIPNENNYYINIDLPNGLMTTYHQRLSFKQQLSGTTEIITEDLRLLERLFFQFRKLIQRNS